jgi:hypothetical protein
MAGADSPIAQGSQAPVANPRVVPAGVAMLTDPLACAGGGRIERRAHALAFATGAVKRSQLSLVHWTLT